MHKKEKKCSFIKVYPIKAFLILDKSRNFKLICIKCKINSDLSSYISFSHFLVTLESSAISNFVVQYHNFMRKYHNFVVQYYHFVIQYHNSMIVILYDLNMGKFNIWPKTKV